jgi:hypothetical protein
MFPQITNVLGKVKTARHRVKRRRLKLWIGLGFSHRSYWDAPFDVKDIREDEIL